MLGVNSCITVRCILGLQLLGCLTPVSILVPGYMFIAGEWLLGSDGKSQGDWNLGPWQYIPLWSGGMARLAREQLPQRPGHSTPLSGVSGLPVLTQYWVTDVWGLPLWGFREDGRPLGSCVVLILYIRVWEVGLCFCEMYHLLGVASVGASAPWEPQLQWFEALVALYRGMLCPRVLVRQCTSDVWLICGSADSWRIETSTFGWAHKLWGLHSADGEHLLGVTCCPRISAH